MRNPKDGACCPAVECCSFVLHISVIVLETLVKFQSYTWPMPSCRQWRGGQVPSHGEVDRTGTESPLRPVVMEAGVRETKALCAQT